MDAQVSNAPVSCKTKSVLWSLKVSLAPFPEECNVRDLWGWLVGLLSFTFRLMAGGDWAASPLFCVVCGVLNLQVFTHACIAAGGILLVGTGEWNSSHVRLRKINSEMIFEFAGIHYKGFSDQAENNLISSVFIFLGRGGYNGLLKVF